MRAFNLRISTTLSGFNFARVNFHNFHKACEISENVSLHKFHKKGQFAEINTWKKLKRMIHEKNLAKVFEKNLLFSLKTTKCIN